MQSTPSPLDRKLMSSWLDAEEVNKHMKVQCPTILNNTFVKYFNTLGFIQEVLKNQIIFNKLVKLD